MRLAHKRKVQMKLQKRTKAMLVASEKSVKTEVVKQQKVKAPVAEVSVVNTKTTKESAAKPIALTPKQQQVLDIVLAQSEGINSKSIGIQAGQDEAKAASWATGALKKLFEENLIEKIQLAGNKVAYKAIS